MKSLILVCFCLVHFCGTSQFITLPQKRTSVLGNIYSGANFTDLSALQTNGGFSVSGGNIIVAPDNQTNYLRIPQASALDKWNFSVANIMTSSSGGTRRLIIGLHSINTTAAVSLQGYLERTTGADYGKAIIYDPFQNLTYKSSTAMTTLNDGDAIVYTFTNNRQSYTFTATNTTTGSISTVMATFSMVYGQPVVAPNTGKFQIESNGTGTYSISSINLTSNAAYGAAYLFVGDSELQGFYQAGPANRVAELVGGELAAGGGDKTAEVLQRIDEIIALNPEMVILEPGINDRNNNVSTSVYIANIQNITNLLKEKGINVVHTTVPPFSGVDVTDYVAAMLAYDPSVINLYALLKASNGTGLNPAYDAGDGIHWNAAGSLAVANLIKSKAFYDPKKVLTYRSNVPVDTAYGFNGDGDVQIWGTAGNLKTKLKVPLGSNSGNVIGTFTASALPVATGVNSLANSVITQNGTSIGFNNTNPQDAIEVNTTLTQAGITLRNTSPAQYRDAFFKAFNSNNVITAFGSTNAAHNLIPSVGFITTAEQNGLLLNGASLRFARDLSNTADMTISASGSVGIGTATPAAILDVSSNTSGMLTPRMTTAQRNAIVSPVRGLEIYNLDTDHKNVYTAGGWKELAYTP